MMEVVAVVDTVDTGIAQVWRGATVMAMIEDD
jgi:hypothetical protein